ncbi:MAG: polysaccharide biosynthesis protein [Actinobacteria bacterium]|nr:polysaccharide biosynthesis protein [Actinomycetota bacterium]
MIKYKPKQIRIFSRDETKQYFLLNEISDIKGKADIRCLIGDVRDKERLDKAFGKVNIVFHTAALKHVHFCEYNPFEAVKTNVYGAQNVIDLSIKHDVDKVIAISTDKAVNPVSVMGSTKLLMEKMFLSTRWYLGESNTKFSIVRFGNVLNSRGSVLPLWIEQIRKNKSITITDPNMTRYIMTIKDAVNLIFEAVKIMHGQEIFVLKMKQKRLSELADGQIKKYGNGEKIEIKVIGMRDGEKTHEELFTENEKKFIVKHKKMYIIVPYSDLFEKRKYNRYIK